MIYAIMCGGEYPEFEIPKQLLTVRGERLVERTIRLFRKYGAEDICILSNNPVFDGLGVPRIADERNDYIHGTDRLWLNAFYDGFPIDAEVCFIFGDVYFTENAVDKIVHCDKPGNVLFGSKISANKLGKNWGEPFAYVIRDYVGFLTSVQTCIQMYYAGMTDRHPIVWEAYRVDNGININRQAVLPETFTIIDDDTIDIDAPERADELNGG